jgi:hypothetical protein
VDELCDRAIKEMDGNKDAMFFTGTPNGFIVKGLYIDQIVDEMNLSDGYAIWMEVCNRLGMEKLYRITYAGEYRMYQLKINWSGNGLMNSRKSIADVNFYKNVVRSVLSNRRSEESAVRSIALRNKCNEGYAKNIFNNYMNKYKDEIIKSDAEIADIQKEFDVDGDLNSWAEDYVPGSGKANTKGGELVRAAQRILTEYYDGGNMIGRGLGNETVNPAARYIVKNTSYEGNDEIEDMLNHVIRMDDGEYDSWLKRFENDFADWLRGNEELFAEPNDDDIADYAEDDDREVVLNKFYVEDSSGNQYFFRNDDDKFVCTGVEFAQDPVYYENDTFTDGDELSSDIDKTEDYGLVEKDGFSYDWEAVGNTDDNGNYSEWRVVRVSIADQLFEVDDVLDIEDMENYSVFDVNGNKIEEKDFMAL